MFSFTREDTTGLAKWWRNIDKQILFSIIFLFLLGLFFSFSSTSQLVGEKLNKETYFLFIKHFIFAIVAIILLFVISFQSEKKIPFTESYNLKNAVKNVCNDIKGNKSNNCTILFSPAAASYDQFKNFEDRGNQFKALIKRKTKIFYYV